MRMVLKLSFVRTQQWASPWMIWTVHLDLHIKIRLTMKNHVISYIFTHALSGYTKYVILAVEKRWHLMHRQKSAESCDFSLLAQFEYVDQDEKFRSFMSSSSWCSHEGEFENVLIRSFPYTHTQTHTHTYI